MTEDRRRRLLALLAANGDGVSSVLGRICALAVSELGVTGAGVTLIDRGGGVDVQQRLVKASDAVATRLEDLQLTVGEGPGLTAVTSGTSVLIPDLTQAHGRWPAFAPEALAVGACAVFAFPLTLGAVRLGSLDCYRTTTGTLGPVQHADALVLAELAFEAIMAEVAGHDRDDLGWIGDTHGEVHQASGMVSYNLGVTIATALLRIRGYAYANELSVAAVARSIVTRELSLEREE
ncbi:MAG TPA: hypothetical protein VHX38_21795 [Pseudonocardiaceae bacterium]|nr:hypothetical protein [Pseudonocardiaceae bacterium]